MISSGRTMVERRLTMTLSLRRGFFGFLIIVVVLLVVRVSTSFAFVAATVSSSLGMGGGPDGLSRLIGDGRRTFAQVSSALAPGQHRTISVFDYPERLREEISAAVPSAEAQLVGQTVVRSHIIDVVEEAKRVHGGRLPGGAIIIPVD
jgi:hypothetical protein